MNWPKKSEVAVTVHTSREESLTPETRQLIAAHLKKWVTNATAALLAIAAIFGSLLFYVIANEATEVAESTASDTVSKYEVELDALVDKMRNTDDEYNDTLHSKFQQIAVQVENVNRMKREMEEELNANRQILDNAAEISDDIDSIARKISQLPDFKDALQLELRDIPTGAVVSFGLRECPKGWNEYEQAYGVFVRGIDRGMRKKDPDGEREPSSYQEDGLKRHRHEFEGDGARRGVTVDRGSFYDEIWKGGDRRQREDRRTTRYGDAETRPKNIALLYCVKVRQSGESG